jgi:F-type H+-transporting ATPase subunit delta
VRITAKQFALSLFESADGKPAGQVRVVIKKFVELLAKKNKIILAEKITKEFAKIWNEKRGLVEAEIISARELSRKMVKLLKGHIAKISGAEEVKAVEKVDKDMLGGVIIKYGDRVLDGSLRGSLMELKDKMIK